MTTSLRNARRLFGALATAAGIAIASSAAADPLEITLNQPPTLGGFPGPYATVTYNRVDNDTATFTFTALGSYFLFDGSTAALNFNLGGGTLSLFSITGNSPCANPYSSGGAGVVGGQGNFNFTINTFNGPNCGSTSITFTVDLVGAAVWLTTADILAPNNLGNLAAAHIAAGCTGTQPNLTCAFTGFAGGNTAVPPNETPEPQTLALLGLGLLGIALSRRRRMR